jgi:hypothetical protein
MMDFHSLFWDTQLQTFVHYHHRTFYYRAEEHNYENPGNPWVPTEGEIYYKKVCDLYGYLTTSIERLNHIPMYLLEENLPTFFVTRIFSEAWYYQYHFENHYILISAVIDYCVNFAVEVFKTPIKNPYSKVNEFLNNPDAKQTPVPNIIRKMKNTFKAINDERKVIIHEGYLRTPVIENIRRLVYASSIFSHDPEAIPLRQAEKREAIEELVIMMNEHNKAMGMLILEFFEAIYVPFEKKVRVLDVRP